MDTPENVVASLTAKADIEYFITESSISTCTAVAESKEKIKVHLGLNMSYKLKLKHDFRFTTSYVVSELS